MAPSARLSLTERRAIEDFLKWRGHSTQAARHKIQEYEQFLNQQPETSSGTGGVRRTVEE